MSATAHSSMATSYGPKQRANLLAFVRFILTRHQQRGGCTEVRIMSGSRSGVCSGYFDAKHVNKLVELIEPPSEPRLKIPFGEHPRIGEANICFTLRTVDPTLMARSANCFSRCPATADNDIIDYDLFGIDIDSERKSGISATKAEKKAAKAVACEIRNWLRERGIEAIFADSGNGYHLMVPCKSQKDIPTAKSQAEKLLQFLDKKFSTDKAKVDTTVANPARLFKLYGTKAIKGSSTEERPHRFSSVKLPDTIQDVDLFEIVAKDLAEDAVLPPKQAENAQESNETLLAKSLTAGGDGGWDAETSVKVLTGVLDHSKLSYRVKHKPEGRMFEFKVCPYHKDHDGDEYECCLIVRTDGKYAAKCQHDPKATWHDFKPLINWDEHRKHVMSECGIEVKKPIANYKSTPQGLVYLRPTKDGKVEELLTNFTARIIADVVEDDGLEQHHTLEIEADINGRKLQFSIPASEFHAMNWPLDRLGGEAIVFPGPNQREHARTAIQVLSGKIHPETIHTHSGWAKHNGESVYLHAGGAIGKDGEVPGVRVKLSPPLHQYELPPAVEGEGLVEAVRTSIKFLDLGPDEVTIPIFAATIRAAVGGCDFSLHLTGPSGTGKSELAAQAQQFYGAELDSRHLPASWSSTANTNEALAFSAKDAVLVVDDFAPTGSNYDVQKLHRDADRLLRGQGNASGRGRMRPDASLRLAKPPRGLIISTGEDVPKGHSLRARMLVLEVGPDTVRWARLTKRQKDAAQGLYAQAMSGFIRCMAFKYDHLQKILVPKKLVEFREQATNSQLHKRTPGMIANLYLGLDMFVSYAKRVGALTADEAQALLDRGWNAIGKAASMQASIQGDSEPVQRFMESLNAAIAAGEAHVASENGTRPTKPQRWGWRNGPGGWDPQGERIGWVVGDDLYLEPQAAFAAAQKMAGRTSEPLAIGSKTLHKRLHEQKLLASTDKARKRLTVRKTLGESHRTVLHLHAVSLYGDGPKKSAKPKPK